MESLIDQIRPAKVATVKARIASGLYDTEAVVDAAVEKVLDVVEPNPDMTPKEAKPGGEATLNLKRLNEIEAAERAVAVAENGLEVAKAEAKTCKEHFDYCVTEMRKIIRKHSTGDAPLFDKPAESEAVEQDDNA